MYSDSSSPAQDSSYTEWLTKAPFMAGLSVSSDSDRSSHYIEGGSSSPVHQTLMNSGRCVPAVLRDPRNLPNDNLEVDELQILESVVIEPACCAFDSILQVVVPTEQRAQSVTAPSTPWSVPQEWHDLTSQQPRLQVPWDNTLAAVGHSEDTSVAVRSFANRAKSPREKYITSAQLFDTSSTLEVKTICNAIRAGISFLHRFNLFKNPVHHDCVSRISIPTPSEFARVKKDVLGREDAMIESLERCILKRLARSMRAGTLLRSVPVTSVPQYDNLSHASRARLWRKIEDDLLMRGWVVNVSGSNDSCIKIEYDVRTHVDLTETVQEAPKLKELDFQGL